MSINIEGYKDLRNQLDAKGVSLVAVSKTKPASDLLALYELGQRDFGENYVQELVEKQAALPKDIRWHFIGHLQTNKVKYIAPFVHLIHGVDSEKLLTEISKQGKKINRVIDCLLQVFISMDENKYGFDEQELPTVLQELALQKNDHIMVKGLMGMASFTEDNDLIKNEFRHLKKIFDEAGSQALARFQPVILSMGMSADYMIAVEAGSNMVRIGSLLFGERNYHP